jgi:hypothetical protein
MKHFNCCVYILVVLVPQRIELSNLLTGFEQLRVLMHALK